LAQTAMTMITGILWCNRVITTDQPIAKWNKRSERRRLHCHCPSWM